MLRRSCASLILIILFSIVFVSRLAAADVELPDGKGKEVVESTCTECHTTERIRAQHLDEEGWNAIVREMIETGASINPDDIKVIVSYLTTTFGPDSEKKPSEKKLPEKKVNVNKAPADEIAAVLQLTPGEASAIVQYRGKNGDFKSIHDIEQVAGLKDKIEARKTSIEF